MTQETLAGAAADGDAGQDRWRFTDAMARLASGLAVLTARRSGTGAPCGLLVSSVCSYSAAPPSVLVCVDERSTSYDDLVHAQRFGVHVLGAADEPVARRFAGRGDKFADTEWGWDGDIPRLALAPVYLACRTARVFCHGDHVVLIGDVTGIRLRESPPLVYYERAMHWRLCQPADAEAL